MPNSTEIEIRRFGKYFLTHNSGDDSRSVRDKTGKVYLRFDASMGVWRDHKLIGHLKSMRANHLPEWYFLPSNVGDPYNTGVAVKDYHWVNIELAEVATAFHLLEP